MLNKKSLYTALSLGAFLVCGPIAALETQNASSEKTAPAADVDIKKLSEAFGNFIGKNLKTSGLNFDIDSLIAG
ncbi:MAG: FKBP-type peptidyl-prolyl cis-trans isomerase, partial [Parachlamydiaceae bacterium]